MLMNLGGLLKHAGAKVDFLHRAETDADVDAVLDVELDGSSARFVIQVKSRSPYPGEVGSLAVMHDRLKSIGTPLLLAPYISESAGKALSDADWSWTDGQGNADIRARGIRIQRRVSNIPPKRNKPALPSGAGSWAIMRSLIADGFAEGATAIARQSGVSQPRASQVLSRLTAAGYLEREGRSRWTANRPALLDAFLAQYAGPGGSTSWFYSLDPPVEVAEKAIVSKPPHSQVAVSGDVAADHLAPWRTPTQVTLYIDQPVATDSLEGVTARGPEDGNIEVIVPNDTSVFDDSRNSELPLAHPTQVIWDLTRHGGADREEAADRVRAWLLSR